MRFNVSGLEKEGVGATREYEIDDAVALPDAESEPVKGSVELLRTNRGVLVRAGLELVQAQECSRCLKPLTQTLPLDFEEEYFSIVDSRSGESADIDPDEENFLIDEHHVLDLTEAIRQYREASATMQPLCRPDCRGLCPRCGKDLNAEDCDCGLAPVDSRWSALASLLPNTESEGKV